MKKAANEQYGKWMGKGASQSLVLPLNKHDLEAWDSVPLGKYLGFLEDVVDQTVKFKHEQNRRKELERIRLLEEEGDDHYQSKILRGRTRLNAHPADV